MSSEILSLLSGRKILILGFGREGQSSYELIRGFFPEQEIGIADKDDIKEEYPGLLNDQYIKVFSGGSYLDACKHYDLVLKSPGIPFEMVARKCNQEKITSQTDLFLRAFAPQITGVTGTKGKSTVTTLIYHILRKAGRDTILSGNIGIPSLSISPQVTASSEIVFEMSSHQLEHISIAPQTAVILNLFPEHLDHYRDFTAYKMAKFNISTKQPSGGQLIYNADDPFICELIRGIAREKELLSFSMHPGSGASAFFDGTDIILSAKNGERLQFPISEAYDMPGEHNIRNMMAAILVCHHKALTRQEIMEGISSYKRLAHRMEFVGEFGGIKFYNDSIATIPESCIEALRTIGKVDLLILGGYDRGLNYSSLMNHLVRLPVKNLVFMGDAGKRMLEEWKESLQGLSACYFVENMEGVFEIVRHQLKPGDVCLLSPAAASYGMFKNFEDRGDTYKKMAAGI